MPSRKEADAAYIRLVQGQIDKIRKLTIPIPDIGENLPQQAPTCPMTAVCFDRKPPVFYENGHTFFESHWMEPPAGRNGQLRPGEINVEGIAYPQNQAGGFLSDVPDRDDHEQNKRFIDANGLLPLHPGDFVGYLQDMEFVTGKSMTEEWSEGIGRIESIRARWTHPDEHHRVADEQDPQPFWEIIVCVTNVYSRQSDIVGDVKPHERPLDPTGKEKLIVPPEGLVINPWYKFYLPVECIICRLDPVPLDVNAMFHRQPHPLDMYLVWALDRPAGEDRMRLKWAGCADEVGEWKDNGCGCTDGYDPLQGRPEPQVYCNKCQLWAHTDRDGCLAWVDNVRQSAQTDYSVPLLLHAESIDLVRMAPQPITHTHPVNPANGAAGRINQKPAADFAVLERWARASVMRGHREIMHFTVIAPDGQERDRQITRRNLGGNGFSVLSARQLYRKYIKHKPAIDDGGAWEDLYPDLKNDLRLWSDLALYGQGHSLDTRPPTSAGSGWYIRCSSCDRAM